MTRRRPFKVFVREIGPTFSFASEARAHERAAALVAGEFAEVLVYDHLDPSQPVEEMARIVYRFDAPVRLERLSKDAPGVLPGTTALGWVTVDLDAGLRFAPDGTVAATDRDTPVPEAVYQAYLDRQQPSAVDEMGATT